MMKFPYLVGLIILLNLVSASHGQQTTKEPNNDLRFTHIKFSMESMLEPLKIVLIEKDGNYLLLQHLKEKETGRKKISVVKAEQIDMEFMEKFIKVKYSFPKFDGKNCNLVFKMSIRGETHQICQSEKDKITLATSMLGSLKKHL